MNKLRKTILLAMTGYSVFMGIVGILASAFKIESLHQHPWLGIGNMAPQTAVCIVCLGVALFFKKLDK